jgi:hypothetical protein
MVIEKLFYGVADKGNSRRELNQCQKDPSDCDDWIFALEKSRDSMEC